MTASNPNPKRITIPASEWPMHDWPADEIVVAGIVMALEGCSKDDDKTRVAVVDAYGQTGHLAHHCKEIPDSVRVKYAADIEEIMRRSASIGTEK